MGPDQRGLERQSSMPSERPKSNYGNYHMRCFKISAYGATPQDSPPTHDRGLKARPIPVEQSQTCGERKRVYLDLWLLWFRSTDSMTAASLFPPLGYEKVASKTSKSTIGTISPEIIRSSEGPSLNPLPVIGQTMIWSRPISPSASA